ncbi:unnamed protein product [Tenebrio molitor]|nr:unnamed protein product [Tenebrio molitor]
MKMHIFFSKAFSNIVLISRLKNDNIFDKKMFCTSVFLIFLKNSNVNLKTIKFSIFRFINSLNCYFH